MSSRGMLSDWHTASTIDLLLDRYLCEGDLLEFDQGRKLHHWGVYAGHTLINGWKKPTVVHFSNADCCNGSVSNDSVTGAVFGNEHVAQDEWLILEDSLTDLINSDKVRISNELDNEWEPYCGSEVLRRANLVSKPTDPESEDWVVPTTFQSCKHFALNCRYGDNFANSVRENTQKKVEKIKTGLQIAGVGAVAAGVGYLLWSQCGKSKSSTKIDDAKKKE